MEIILIGHKKRQGKDTFSDMLKKHLQDNGLQVAQLSFADPMKDIMAEALGVSRNTLDAMKNGCDYHRQILQRFGSGLMKNHFGDTVWRDIAIKKIEREKFYGCDCVIIPDFRFPCEYIDGAITVNVKRDDAIGDEHISETALDGYNYDFTINNTGTLKALENMAENFAKQIGENNG